MTDDIKNFMASTWIDQTAYREPITYAEAEANIKEWEKEGVGEDYRKAGKTV